MIKNKKILAIIPARGGSKRLPKKNIRLLGGKPLIYHTIKAALNCRLIDKTVVSTENIEIAKLSKKFGAEVIIRPKNLATDKSPSNGAIKHVLKTVKQERNYSPDIVMLLQATSPLRTAEDINKAIKMFFGKKCDSLVSVCKTNPFWSMTIKNGYLNLIFHRKEFLTKREQDLPNAYKLNGAIYITTARKFFRYNSFFNKKTIAYIMPSERSIDIDEKTDFELAKVLIKNKNGRH